MRKRAQKLNELPRGCDNIEFYGLQRGQEVTVKCEQYNGKGWIIGCPPQGTGFYVLILTGEKLWLAGRDIVEATKPS